MSCNDLDLSSEPPRTTPKTRGGNILGFWRRPVTCEGDDATIPALETFHLELPPHHVFNFLFYFLCALLNGNRLNSSLEWHRFCTYSPSGSILSDFIHKLHIIWIILSDYFLFYCYHRWLYLSMIDGVSCWDDCLSQYIYIYILNVKLGMPVFYTCKVVSYLLVSRLKTYKPLCLRCKHGLIYQQDFSILII